MIRVLMVCTGNICRAPTAEGVLRAKVTERGLGNQFEVDSAGLISYHVGESPDPRSMRMAASRGIDISDQRSRRIRGEDFVKFDYILAMDRGHQSELEGLAPAASHKIKTLLSFLAESDVDDVPDPYYGGSEGFAHTFDYIERGCDAFLDQLESEGQL